MGVLESHEHTFHLVSKFLTLVEDATVWILIQYNIVLTTFFHDKGKAILSEIFTYSCFGVLKLMKSKLVTKLLNILFASYLPLA